MAHPTDMRILQVSCNDHQGGAARAATRLHQALSLDPGISSKMFVVNKTSDVPNIKSFQFYPFLPAKISRLLYRLGRRLHHPVSCIDGTLYSMDWNYYGAQPARQFPESDLVNLHWIVDLLDYRANLPLLAKKTPLVWTFHDMNAFTGGCHYSNECERFTDACGACPMLGSKEADDLSSQTILRKQKALQGIPDERITVVSPSNWLAGESRRSALFGRFQTEVIPNGIDPDEYTPVDRHEARRIFGLEEKDKIILFVADAVSDLRKGFHLLNVALQELTDIEDLFVLTIGRGITEQALPCRSRHLGTINEIDRLSLAYSAADIFVIPSLQDNLPNTILEAMSCARPVVAFRTGGMIDLVKESQTGLLANAGDARDLAQHLRWLLDHPAQSVAMGLRGRESVLGSFTLRHQAENYRRLYERILDQKNLPGR